ncbi:MAG TPA: bifunctional DNA primase/polymerase, partial [Pseudomonadales bacterium]|nr:bifunctional DNA primase/polymerase [Pseudomonadales bacterium]
MSKPNSVLEWALEYLRMGWAVFPLHSIDSEGKCTCGAHPCGDAGKHPTVRRGVKEASKDEAQIRAWFNVNHPINIGLATGEISGITVL